MTQFPRERQQQRGFATPWRAEQKHALGSAPQSRERLAMNHLTFCSNTKTGVSHFHCGKLYTNPE
ncbi:unnamed protein product [Dovyalis caffra]|uniref:Uncharacterized protein n=1 Tax=Dovyalis caffra TaxID=77055 RepID=A0AAV1R1I8_9ROSI|nr:unnamed protein product [Dovyalis caffra]